MRRIAQYRTDILEAGLFTADELEVHLAASVTERPVTDAVLTATEPTTGGPT
ncbi:hypothetical protein [Nocardia thraciensis]